MYIEYKVCFSSPELLYWHHHLWYVVQRWSVWFSAASCKQFCTLSSEYSYLTIIFKCSVGYVKKSDPETDWQTDWQVSIRCDTVQLWHHSARDPAAVLWNVWNMFCMTVLLWMNLPWVVSASPLPASCCSSQPGSSHRISLILNKGINHFSSLFPSQGSAK